MKKMHPVVSRFALFLAVAFSLAGCNGGGGGSAADTPPAVSAAAKWFFPDGSSLSSSQVATLFDTSQLYFNVPSSLHGTGEIRGEITPSASVYQTDSGDPFAANPANTPVTFAALLGGDQVRPRNVVTGANGYGSVTLDPLTRKLTGFIVTSGISGTQAQIHDGLPGSSGALVLALEGGPVVWTVPANTVLSDAQITRLSAGAFYFEVNSDLFSAGEIRGQLDRQVRCALLKGSSEVPPVTSSGSAVGFLSFKQSTRQFSGHVKAAGFSSAIRSVVLHIGAAGTNGAAIVNLVNRGGGIWALPANTVLGDPQVANFNNDELYFTVHTESNIGGEARGQLLKPQVKIGTAVLAGLKELPPVSSPGTGAGIIAWNSVTEQVTGSVTTDGFVAAATELRPGSATTTEAPLIDLNANSPVTGVPTPGISFALDIQPIFSANCTAAFCHVSEGIGAMSLQPGVAYANTLPLITPGNSASSYMINRLTGAITPRMPLNRPALSAFSLDLIKAWIDNGAQDN